MTMKSVKVAELKANLSRYLRLAARGARIIVKDRDEPIAQLGPLEQQPASWRERAAREGWLRPGTQDWARLKVSPLDEPVDVQASLQAVREEPSEVRRR
jgi:antitoxin (DNA-binding transcriptional repressor) of toxin-antitoxin stability system